MTAKNVSFVLDSYAVLVLLEQQNGWEVVRSVLDHAVENNERLILSAINYGEVYYTVLRRFGRERLSQVSEHLALMPIEIVVPDLPDIERAAELKAKYACSFADCFAVALSQKLGLAVMTGDPEFRAVEADGVSVNWLPPNRTR